MVAAEGRITAGTEIAPSGFTAIRCELDCAAWCAQGPNNLVERRHTEQRHLETHLVRAVNHLIAVTSAESPTFEPELGWLLATGYLTHRWHGPSAQQERLLLLRRRSSEARFVTGIHRTTNSADKQALQYFLGKLAYSQNGASTATSGAERTSEIAPGS